MKTLVLESFKPLKHAQFDSLNISVRVYVI